MMDERNCPDEADPEHAARDETAHVRAFRNPVVHTLCFAVRLYSRRAERGTHMTATPTNVEQDSRDDMVNAVELGQRERHARIPRQHVDGRKDESEEQPWQQEDRDGRIPLAQRSRPQPPIGFPPKLGHRSIPRRDRVELFREIERRLTLGILGPDIASRFDDFCYTSDVALYDGPVQRCQTTGIGSVWIGAEFDEQVDGEAIALVACPLQTSPSRSIRRVGRYG